MLSPYHLVVLPAGKILKHEMINPERVDEMNRTLASWEMPGAYVPCDCLNPQPVPDEKEKRS